MIQFWQWQTVSVTIPSIANIFEIYKYGPCIPIWSILVQSSAVIFRSNSSTSCQTERLSICRKKTNHMARKVINNDYVCTDSGTTRCGTGHTLIKKKIEFSSYIWKFRVEQLQSHIWGRPGFLIYEEMRKYFPIYEGRRPLVIHDFATAPFWISLYLRKILFLFYHCTIGAAHIFWSTQLRLHPILPHPAEYVSTVISMMQNNYKLCLKSASQDQRPPVPALTYEYIFLQAFILTFD